MPRTLLLALIATAVSACNKPSATLGTNAGDNLRKQPLRDMSGESRREEHTVVTDIAVTH
jgi:hypothetical protein